MRLGGETGDVPDVADQAGGAGGADAVELEQAAAGRGDDLLQLGFRGLDLFVDAGQFGDQLRGQLTPGAADDVPWTDRREQRTGLGCGQKLRCSTGHQLQQKSMDLVDRPGSLDAELVAAIDQQPQRDGRIVGLDRPQPGRAQRNQRNRVGIDRIGLAAVACREPPSLRRQLRRHVDHRLAGGHKSLRDVTPDTRAALHGPDTARVSTARGQQVPEPIAVRGEPTDAQHLLLPIDDLDRHRPLVRIHPDDDL